jgi:hypothetical protein
MLACLVQVQEVMVEKGLLAMIASQGTSNHMDLANVLQGVGEDVEPGSSWSKSRSGSGSSINTSTNASAGTITFPLLPIQQCLSCLAAFHGHTQSSSIFRLLYIILLLPIVPPFPDLSLGGYTPFTS